jgi:hypothetical protein
VSKIGLTVLMSSLFLGGCSSKNHEELVLVEFAARLEEEYHKMHRGSGGSHRSDVEVVDVDGTRLGGSPSPGQPEPVRN